MACCPGKLWDTAPCPTVLLRTSRTVSSSEVESLFQRTLISSCVHVPGSNSGLGGCVNKVSLVVTSAAPGLVSVFCLDVVAPIKHLASVVVLHTGFMTVLSKIWEPWGILERSSLCLISLFYQQNLGNNIF